MHPNLKEDGFLKLEGVLPLEVCKDLCIALEEWHTPKNHSNPYGILHHNIYQEIPLFKEVLEQHRIGTLATNLYRGDLLLFQDNLVWKPPGTSQKIEWHQDYAYWPLNAPLGVTLWIALEDCTEPQGVVEYIPGSQNWGECLPTNFIKDGTAFWGKELPELPIPEHIHKKHSIPRKAGEAIAHHPLCSHFSGSNETQTHRRAWSLSFVCPSLLWDPDHAPHPYNHWYNPKKGNTIDNDLFPRFVYEDTVCRN